MAQGSQEEFELWLEPRKLEKKYFLAVWQYRHLLKMLAWRDIRVRYKQTLAGSAWAIFQPLMSMLLMTVIFGKVAGLPTQGNAPYALMVFAGLLPWQYFSQALQTSSQSLVSNANLISKVYFPRLIIPVSSLVVASADFMVAMLIVMGMMVYYHWMPSLQFLSLPFWIALTFFVALGPGLLITALNVRYRDFRAIIPFVLQFGMYASPVAYSAALIEQKLSGTWIWLYRLNPMVGVIEGFRWAILGGDQPFPTASLYMALGISTIAFVWGLWYFRKCEKHFADMI